MVHEVLLTRVAVVKGKLSERRLALNDLKLEGLTQIARAQCFDRIYEDQLQDLINQKELLTGP